MIDHHPETMKSHKGQKRHKRAIYAHNNREGLETLSKIASIGQGHQVQIHRSQPDIYQLHEDDASDKRRRVSSISIQREHGDHET